jgi:hypothetical protein
MRVGYNIKETECGMLMGKTGLEPCPVANFGVIGVSFGF